MKLVDQNDEMTSRTDLESLKAQRRALNEEIHATKATAPKANPLEALSSARRKLRTVYAEGTRKPNAGPYRRWPGCHVALTEVLAFFEAKARSSDEAIEEALDRDADADAKMDSGK